MIGIDQAPGSGHLNSVCDQTVALNLNIYQGFN